MQKLVPLLAAALASSPACTALASSSGWIETDGGRVRLVSTGMPDAEGRLKGALVIELKPGWKTYWSNPGETGIAPSLDLTESINVSGAEIAFPAPKRFDDGYSEWAGYDRPVSLPVTFTIPEPKRFAAIEAAVFLGICETICIPVQGELSLEPGAEPDNPADAIAVKAAFAALPAPAREDFRISSWLIRGDIARFEAELPTGAESAELFLAGDGISLGAPELIETGATAHFEAPVIGDRPPDAENAAIRYVLKADGEAVSGTLRPE